MDYLKVDHVTKNFGGITALNDVSFTVNEGSLLGVIAQGDSKVIMKNEEVQKAYLGVELKR